MERMSRAELTVISAALLLAAGLILYHAFDAQPLEPVVETFSAFAAAATHAAVQPPASPGDQKRPAAAPPPATRQETQARQGDAPAETRSGPVNLNTATREELMTLSGIGEVKAEAILAYRLENGAFQSVEELLEVSGIGEKTLEKLRAQVCV